MDVCVCVTVHVYTSIYLQFSSPSIGDASFHILPGPSCDHAGQESVQLFPGVQLQAVLTNGLSVSVDQSLPQMTVVETKLISQFLHVGHTCIYNINPQVHALYDADVQVVCTGTLYT